MIQRIALVAPFVLALSGCAFSTTELEQEEPTSTSQEAFVWHTHIDFDTATSGAPIANGAAVDSAYAGAGVTFSSIICTSTCVPGSAFARPTGNPGNGVSLFASGYSGFDSRYGAIEATFATPPFQVSIDVRGTPFVEGLGAITARPYIAAYDAAGNFMSIVYGNSTPNVWQTLTITGSNIGKVRFSSQAIAPYVYSNFDNLGFDIEVSRPIKLPPGKPRPIFPLTPA
jgi:hypothetical protein